jgi:glycosyltransferase involved in cell wall biosynthesis
VNSTENKNLKVGLLIPIYNVEKTISKVLDSVASTLDESNLDILIVDNNSSDKTISIVQMYLKKNPLVADHVTLIQHKSNYGYGCSIKSGFIYFSSKPVSHVMIIHGDHQVDPAWLMRKLVATVKLKPHTDLVLASRFKPESYIENYSILRRLGNYFFNAMTTFCSGHRMSDSGTAMIIFRNDIINKVPFRNLSNSWQFHPQLNILLYDVPNIRIEEISMDWSDSEADSTVPLFRYGLMLLKMLLWYWFKKNILKKPPQERFSLDTIPLNREFSVLFSPPISPKKSPRNQNNGRRNLREVVL